MRRSSINRVGQGAGRRPLGQALVEFALVLPVFLLIVFGIIDVGRYVYMNNAFNQAAREAARYGSVEQWSYSCPASVPVASQNRFTCTAAGGDQSDRRGTGVLGRGRHVHHRWLRTRWRPPPMSRRVPADR